MTNLRYTNRFEEAFLFAAQLHADQKRKGTDVPYIAHLMAVTALVLENDGDEDQAIAALLHDAVEDQGGLATLDEIRRRFGERVAEIVDGCTDTYQTPKPPWKHRKQNYIEHLGFASADVLLVSLADKLHNARTIKQHLQQHGIAVWERFNGGREGTLWYYRTLLPIFREKYPSQMVEEFAQVVAEIEKIDTDFR